MDLESKSQKPLTRYFPELTAALLRLRARRFVLDGEIVIPADGSLSFDYLLMRIHPAASRVAKLSRETPCVFIVFDLLVDERGRSLVERPLEERRSHLERFAKAYFSEEENRNIRLSPVTGDVSVARKWFQMGVGLDGIIAKRDDLPYQTGERTGMRKIKETAHGGLRGRRVSLSGERAAGGFAAARFIQRAGAPRSCGIHFLNSSGGACRAHQAARRANQAAGIYGQGAGRPEPLEHETLDGMAAARAETRGRGRV